MDCILVDSPNMTRGVVYLGLELVDKSGIEVDKLKIELLSSRCYYLLSNSILLMNLLILHVKKSFNIFHSSVDGYECHSDGLQEILSKSSYKL